VERKAALTVAGLVAEASEGAAKAERKAMVQLAASPEVVAMQAAAAWS
jgi:hypothetical protein